MLVHTSGFQMSPYADIKPAGDAGQGRRPRSCGTAAPGARDESDRPSPPLGLLAWPSPPPATAASPSAPAWSGTAYATLLDGDAWSSEQQARIVDIGGGTGGFAVPLAELGHRVQVIDPSPDALAALDRRARERGRRRPRSPASRATSSDLPSLVDEADLVLCHGVLEMVDDPAASLAAIAGVLRPGGHLSLLVAQRHAAVVARAMAGHFQAARELLDGDPTTAAATGGAGAASPTTSSSTCSPRPGCSRRRSRPCGSSPTSCPAASSTSSPVRPPRWSSSSAPSPTRPEYLPLATQLHVLARR